MERTPSLEVLEWMIIQKRTMLTNAGVTSIGIGHMKTGKMEKVLGH
jgi:hypothetical protein